MKIELYRSRKFAIQKAYLEKITRAITHVLPRFRRRSEISLALVDNATVRRLNKTYRHRNAVTDVLSFAERDVKGSLGRGAYLGEIIIAYPRAVRQARQNNRRVQEEIVILLVHGFLHLVGYDHGTPQLARLMRGHEQRIRRVFEKMK